MGRNGIMMEKQAVQDIYSLTPMQEGILFHYLKDPDSKAYYEQRSFELTGVVDKDTLHKSFQRLVDRYDIFRTNFVYKKTKRPRQVVFEARAVTLAFTDLSKLPETEKEPAVARIKAEMRQAGFDLTKDLLVRINLIKHAEAAYTLILDFHHIIMDGWAAGIIFKDLITIYQALQTGATPQLPPAVPYSRYIQWLERQDSLQATPYWQQLLADYEQTASMPYFKRSGAALEYAREELTVELGLEQSNRLREVAAKNEVTLNTMLQAGWALLLATYNGVEDVVFGIVVSGRPPEIEGIESMVGLFINTLPVRVRINTESSIKELLQDIHSQLSHSGQYAYMALADIQAEHPLKSNLLDHILVFENYPLDEEVTAINHSSALGFAIETVDSFEQTSYHFNIAINPADNIRFTFNFNRNLYDPDYLKLIQRQFCHILNQIATDDSAPIKQINVLDVASKHQLLTDFNPAPTVYPQDCCLHELFQQQALKTPHHPAVLYLEQSLSYGELNAKANQLARVLRQKGVVPDQLVGILADRSSEMMIAILAIWKAGGAYLPIDPEYPYARKEYLIQAGAVRLLLIQKSLMQDHLKLLWHIDEMLPLDDAGLYKGDDTNLPTLASPHHLAYVMFTSGTTGNPKGVMIEQRSVVNLITAQQQTFNVTPDERILQFSSFCFDASVEQIGLAWLSGATLVLIDKATLLDMRKFAAYIQAMGVTHIHAVPSFLETINLMAKSKLKRLIAGGDSCPLSLALNWYTECDFYNEYGPTETTVTSIEYQVKALTGDEPSLSIGYPLANTFIYLLDQTLQLVPIGVPGRLYIGGAGVARGYLNQPDLTASVFLTNPFRPDEKMYDTGDYARWLPDGRLEYLGRKDNQVKIRGFRIELAEIEAALKTVPGVQTSIVAVKLDSGHYPSLCGYYTAAESIDEQLLKKHLAGRLPTYMIPAYFFHLETVPLNRNGKVDRNLLPSPLQKSQVALTPPRTDLERKLRDLWAEALNVPADSIGLTTHFTELGGHSLKAIFLISKIHKELEVEVPIDEFFKESTIAGLAEYIENAGKTGFASIKPSEPRPFYPLTAAQKSMYVLHQLDPESISYNAPAFVWLKGNVQPDRLQTAFATLIMRHASLRTAFSWLNGELIQIVQDNLPVFTLEYAECTETEAHSLARNFLRPFDLSKAPLVRVGLLKVAADKHILIVDMHHIICDGVSMDLMVRELIGLYGGEEYASLRLQYPDYAIWQQSQAYQQALHQQKEYWLTKLGGELPILNLPLDYPRPEFQSFEGSCLNFEIDPPETAALEKLAADSHSTLYVVLVAVLNLFLSKITGQAEILIGTPVAGRRHIDLQHIVGLFVNTLVLRNFPAPELSFMEFLADVRNRTFADFENQDVAFEDLVTAVCSKRDLSRNPLFDVMFELETYDPNLVLIPGVSLEPYSREDTVAKFDLTFSCMKRDERLCFDFEYGTRLFKPATAE